MTKFLNLWWLRVTLCAQPSCFHIGKLCCLHLDMSSLQLVIYGKFLKLALQLRRKSDAQSILLSQCTSFPSIKTFNNLLSFSCMLHKEQSTHSTKLSSSKTISMVIVVVSTESSLSGRNVYLQHVFLHLG